ncbi:MAG: hypothetical protein GF346_13425 [Candidatus Eisenbacteria bacterium]|nr:hypothetical protein [Candidatus Latescibacterota bacterium]MBD3303441.1 hypothetical protein [Candidatus Eisenbacteria bacterium]
MFGKQEESGGTVRSQSLIQQGVVVRGEVRAEGDVRLEGTLEGSIQTKSRVIIGGSGVVHADVAASEILVMGKVTGKLSASKRIELRKGARVEGDLSTQALVIEEGVFFQGMSQMNVPGAAKPDSVASPQPAERRDRTGKDHADTQGRALYSASGSKKGD